MSPLELLQSPPVLLTAAALVGLCLGSFLNVVVYRLPKILERRWRAECAELNGAAAEESAGTPYNLVLPRSACPACGHRITALQNIPLLSYALLGGRCAQCRARIPLRYPAVEALTAALTVFVAWHFGPTLTTLAALVLVWSLVALAFIDLDTFYLPDDITLPLVWAGLVVNLFGIFTDLPSAVIGAIVGYLSLWSVYWAYKLLTGKEGMGYGDFKLLAAIGAWLGWQQLPLVILLSSVVGAVIGIGLIIAAQRGRNVPIPFGPYLVIAALIALVWGEAILRHYLKQI
jgi:leader peptidase (prepilin peptidase)/N-methyltransferase